jgi:hypothetical protein
MLDRCRGDSESLGNLQVPQFPQPDPDEGHVVYGVFQIVDDLPAVVGVEADRLLPVFCVYSLQSEGTVGSFKSGEYGVEHVGGAPGVRLRLGVPPPRFIVDATRLVTILQALEHLYDVAGMLSDVGAAEVVAGGPVLLHTKASQG